MLLLDKKIVVQNTNLSHYRLVVNTVLMNALQEIFDKKRETLRGVKDYSLQGHPFTLYQSLDQTQKLSIRYSNHYQRTE